MEDKEKIKLRVYYNDDDFELGVFVTCILKNKEYLLSHFSIDASDPEANFNEPFEVPALLNKIFNIYIKYEVLSILFKDIEVETYEDDYLYNLPNFK